MIANPNQTIEEDEDMMVSSPEMAIKPAPALEDDDEDILEATQVEEEAPSQKSRKRKLVSKTVMGADGFVGMKSCLRCSSHQTVCSQCLCFFFSSHNKGVCLL